MQQPDGEHDHAQHDRVRALAPGHDVVQPPIRDHLAGVVPDGRDQHAGRRENGPEQAGGERRAETAAEPPCGPEEQRRTQAVKEGGQEMPGVRRAPVHDRGEGRGGYVNSGRIDVMERHAEEPERQPREIAPVAHGEPGDGDEQAFDGAEVLVKFDLEQTERNVRVQRKQSEGAEQRVPGRMAAGLVHLWLKASE